MTRKQKKRREKMLRHLKNQSSQQENLVAEDAEDATVDPVTSPVPTVNALGVPREEGLVRRALGELNLLGRFLVSWTTIGALGLTAVGAWGVWSLVGRLLVSP